MSMNVQETTIKASGNAPLDVAPFLLMDSGPCDAAFNMAMDEALLLTMPRLRQPILRFYGWTEPAATFGYFQSYAAVESATRLRPLIRRPTGGGIVPHDADWTYSLAFPETHPWYGFKAIESYRQVHEWIRRAFARLGLNTELAPCCSKTALGQCFAGYEQYDLLWQARKIAGAAQRRTRDGLLIQGSVQAPHRELQRENWHSAMRDAMAESQVVHWRTYEPTTEVMAKALNLVAEKYSLPSYNRKR